MLPFDATKANCCGGFADLLQYFRDFAGYEFLCGRSGEIAVEHGTMGRVARYRLTASGSLSPQKAWCMASSQGNVCGHRLGSTCEGLHLE